MEYLGPAPSYQVPLALPLPSPSHRDASSPLPPNHPDCLDYSFAMEYLGPAPSYQVPLALPLPSPSHGDGPSPLPPTPKRSSPHSASSSSSAPSELTLSHPSLQAQEGPPRMPPPFSESPSRIRGNSSCPYPPNSAAPSSSAASKLTAPDSPSPSRQEDPHMPSPVSESPPDEDGSSLLSPLQKTSLPYLPNSSSSSSFAASKLTASHDSSFSEQEDPHMSRPLSASPPEKDEPSLLPPILKSSHTYPSNSASSSSSVASKFTAYYNTSFSEQEDPLMSPPVSDPPSFASFSTEGSLYGSKIDTIRYQEDHSFSTLDTAFTLNGPDSTMPPSKANGYTDEDAGPSYPDAKKEQRKKGECYRCFKGHRFQEKETCLVCGSKYCRNCVLKAMGSMPEGRKCVKCIGQPINEARRPSLGKPPRLLNRILSHLEVQQITKAERECPANQLQPEQLFVNGRHLRAEEMAELLGCSNPPVKLKPGKYWYDKQSGFWGKEGEKPDRVITALLNVGGQLPKDGSNGNTEIFINGREITKTEMKMLKFVGVQFSPKTHLWLYADGNCQEEGQNNIICNIWEKAAKFPYPFFTLPTPRSNVNGSRVDVNNSSTRSIPGYLEQKKTDKLLLLGHEGSGTSTIYKQAKFLYKDENFTKDELQSMKLMIQSNIIKYFIILLEGRERFEEEEEEKLARSCKPGESDMKNIYSINARLKQSADWFLEIMANGDLGAFFPAAIREYAPVVDEMWRNPAIQATFQRKTELHMLPDVAEYFLERVLEVSTNEYDPSENDILLAEGVAQGAGLAEVEFTLDERSPISETYNGTYDPSPNFRFQLIRVSSKGMNDNCKLLEMFEDVRAIIFCVAINEYAEMWIDANNALRNKMVLSKELIETVLRHPCFWDTPVVLLLNKYDLFVERIRTVPLTVCEWFLDFDPVRASHNTAQTLAQQAYTYIAHKFKKLFESINTTGRKLYTYQISALDRSMVDAAFQYAREILKWEETKASTSSGLPADSIYSTEYSSLSLPSNQGGDP